MANKSTSPDSTTSAVSPASASSLPPTSAIGLPPTYTKSPPSHHNATYPPTPSPSPVIASSPPSIPPETSPPPVGSPPPFTSPPPTNSPPPTASSPPPAPVAKPPTNSPPKRKRSPPPPPPPAVSPPETSLSPVPSIVPSPVNAPLPPKLTPPTSHHSPPPPSHISPSYSPPASSSPSSSGGIDTAGAVAIVVAAGVFVVTFIGLIVWYLRKQKRGASSGLNGGHVMPYPSGSPLPSDSASSKMSSTPPFMGSGYCSANPRAATDPGGLGNSTSWFTHEELVEATNGFSSQNLLGEGGFGSVYKGYLPDGKVVAVKQLKIGGGQGEREFKAEVEIISRVHHRHLVSLVGYCIYKNSRLLVYEYVPNNTLHSHLHGEGWPVLDWVTRVKIAAGAARGIAYLHEDCYPRIIHRDIKSSNILLDNNYEAKVSDFGLAKLAVDANTHVTTRVMGTFGYLAPEYASSGKLTDKSDVFSYGVVLLELITGRKPVDPSQPSGNESLVEWARPLLSYALDNEEFDGLVDPKLGKNYVEIEMFRMIEAAAACVRHSAAKRPRMGQIVRAFDSLVAADLSNGMRVGESEVFNSAPQSAEIRLLRRMAFGGQNLSTDFFSLGSLGSREHTANTSREQYQYRSSISGPVSQTEVKR